MPETNTYFSGGMPIVGRSFWTVARIAKSPQPGHQRTIWSLTKSLRVSIGPEPGRISRFSSAMLISPALQQRFDGAFDFRDLERLALDLVEAHGGDKELRPQDLEQLSHVHLGDQ